MVRRGLFDLAFTRMVNTNHAAFHNRVNALACVDVSFTAHVFTCLVTAPVFLALVIVMTVFVIGVAHLSLPLASRHPRRRVIDLCCIFLFDEHISFAFSPSDTSSGWIFGHPSNRSKCHLRSSARRDVTRSAPLGRRSFLLCPPLRVIFGGAGNGGLWTTL